jgi:uncharacterized protein with GYD domain
MIFITFAKFRKKPTKESIIQSTKHFEEMKKQGLKVHGMYWTLGRYDAIVILEAPDKDAIKGAMKAAIETSDSYTSETLVALTREEAIKLVE